MKRLTSHSEHRCSAMEIFCCITLLALTAIARHLLIKQENNLRPSGGSYHTVNINVGVKSNVGRHPHEGCKRVLANSSALTIIHKFPLLLEINVK